MPWRGAEVEGEFPTLGFAIADWIEDQCAIPDGDDVGAPFLLTEEQLNFLLWFYRLVPETGAFYYSRGAQLVRPQKWGKGPFSAAIICAEAAPEGPVRFDGWDASGEPVGRHVATPVIQVTAASEDQADNVWSALLPMIELGALSGDISDTGLTRVFLPNGGKIEPVTSSAKSRRGQRITFVVQDETSDWLEIGGGRKLADTQRRGIAGMGGRFLETCNAWDPALESVAQQTSEDREPGVYLDDVEPDENLSIRNKRHRAIAMKQVYGNAITPDSDGRGGWIDPDRLDVEIQALLKRDPHQAEMYFLNRKQAGEKRAFDIEHYKSLGRPHLQPARGSLVVVGVDGARFVDSLAIVATSVDLQHQWNVGIWERPKTAGDDYQHPFNEIDGAMLELFDDFYIWRVGVDPQWIEESLLHPWQKRWGEKRVVPWFTNRPRPICFAVRNYSDAIAASDLSHDADDLLIRHHRHAVKQSMNVYDDKHRKMHTLSKDRPDSPRKMDGAMAATISWELMGDAIAADARVPAPAKLFTFS